MFRVSKSVKVNYNATKTKGASISLELDISGRGSSVLSYGTSTPQGDHVTAYRLVEEGLYRKLDDLTNGEVNGLSELPSRNALRVRRGYLYDYVSAIAAIDSTRATLLYQEINTYIASYNKLRSKKSDIKKKTEAYHKDPTLFGTAYQAALQNQEARFKDNGEKLRILFQETITALLSFYNRIPHTSYHKIENFKDKDGDIKVSRTKMQAILKWIATQPKNPPIASATLAAKRPEVAAVMNSLIHYPEITDPAALAKHAAENVTRKGKFNKPRNNTKDTLVMLLARHIHIFLAVYPELKSSFNQNGELVDEFVDKFIGVGAAKPNWPSFTNSVDLQSIKAEVKNAIAVLEKNTKDNHYNQWRKNLTTTDALDSSDDEEISTHPKNKTENTQDELSQLRKMREIVLKNRGSIPKEIMQEIDGALSHAAATSSNAEQKHVSVRLKK